MIIANSNVTSQKGIEELKDSSNNKRAELDRDDFMKLFVTQLQYQDPMNPMESAQMASQVAQFNMVDLLYKNNEAMNALVDSTRAKGLTEAVSFLGKEVTYEGSAISVNQGNASPIKISVTKPTASTEITIRDNAGDVVAHKDIGAITGSEKEFSWDALDPNGVQVADGTYYVTVTAKDQGGNQVEASTWTSGVVTGVTSDADGAIHLSLDTGEAAKLNEIGSVKIAN